jgi:purine-binding chemotaxis protein CheW
MTALYVLFKVAGGEYVLAAADVLHMESFTGATKVPGTPAHVAGLMQVRGRVVPVIDLRARFGLDPQPAGPEARVVVVERAGRAVALLADTAREVLRLDPGRFRAAPEMVRDTGQGFVKAVAHTGGDGAQPAGAQARLVMLLDLDKVIEEESPHGEQRNGERSLGDGR